MNYAPGSSPNPDPNATGPYAGSPPVDPAAPGYVPVPPFTPDTHTNMAAAVLLGFIPGVGAMYNGQYAKALAHVVIFAILVSMADNVNGIFGLVVAAWIAYMVFDSYHTARARREGTPLPNAFGLNDAASWFGPRSRFTTAYYGDANRPAPSASSFTNNPPPPPQPYAGYYAPPVPPVPPVPGAPLDPAAYQSCQSYPSRPTGAIILIVLGVLFLLSTFGILSGRWIAHGWPLLVIGLGVFLLIRRLQPRGIAPGGVDQGGMR